MESSTSGIKRDDHSISYDAKQQALFLEMVALLKFLYPYIMITKEGENFSFRLKKDSEGQLWININIPFKGVLENFTITQDEAEFKVLYRAETKTHEYTENPLFSSMPDLKLTKMSCPTEKDICENKTLKNPQWNDYNCDDQADGNSSCEDYSVAEYEKPCYRGTPVELNSHFIKKIDACGQSALEESVTLTWENSIIQRDTLIMFYRKGVFYSSLALMLSNILDNEIGNSFKVLVISEMISGLQMAVFASLNEFTVSQIAKRLKYFNDGRQVRNREDLLKCLNLSEQEKLIPEMLERKNEGKEGGYNICNSNIDSKVIIERNQKQLDQYECEKQIRTIKNQKHAIIDINSQQIHFKTEEIHKTDYNEKYLETKEPSHSKWAERTKMGKNKLKTQHPVWKLYFGPREDARKELARQYFEEGTIRQAVFEFFGANDERRCKASFERPNVPWPSMHPLLPYKLRVLDIPEAL